MSSSVPNWGNHFKLVDAGTTHPDVAPLLRGRKGLNVLTLGRYLDAAKTALTELLNGLSIGELRCRKTEQLANEFAGILRNLCLAWHLAFLAPAEVSSLCPATLDALSYWIPPLNWNTRLIPQDADPVKTDES